MSTRTRIWVMIGGIAAGGVAYAVTDWIYAGLVLFAALCFAASGQSVTGTTPITGTSKIDPKVVRQYREEHPGATITEAIAATRTEVAPTP